MYYLRFTREAHRDFDSLTPEQRRAIWRLAARVQRDPAIDNRTKLALYSQGVTNAIAQDSHGHWVMYYVMDDVINVTAVGVGNPHIDPSTLG